MVKTLAVDVGAKTWGYCYKDKLGEDAGWNETKSFEYFYRQTGSLIALWKPEIIVVGKPNIAGSFNYNVVTSHSKYIGILCLLAEKAGIPLVEVNDKTARRTLFPGEGCVKKVEYLKVHFPNVQQDQADATVMARSWVINQLPNQSNYVETETQVINGGTIRKSEAKDSNLQRKKPSND